MAQTLTIGKKFEDFSSLETAIQQYQKEENVQFFRRSSFEHQKLTLKVIENKILQPPVRLSVRQSTILLFVFVLRSNIST